MYNLNLARLRYISDTIFTLAGGEMSEKFSVMILEFPDDFIQRCIYEVRAQKPRVA